MINFNIERMKDCFSEIKELSKVHVKEVRPFGSDEIKLNEDYYLGEESNFVLYTFRNEGQLVGYATFVIYQDNHCIDRWVAHQDSIFIKEELRRYSLSFMRFIERTLKQAKINVIIQSAPNERLEKIFKFRKYKDLEKVFYKEL